MTDQNTKTGLKPHSARNFSLALSHHASWLQHAVFYEVYPQSFADSNNDGIGDLPGLTAHLPYIRDLGCTAIWINPCFSSPFRDAGYDVSDYLRVAPRYGTNGDLIALFKKAHRLGLHVLLDLVPGHTSDQHPWFRASQRWDPADRTMANGENVSDRYIWTRSAFDNSDGLPHIAGTSDRNGAYIINFFAFQPALNYGFLHPSKPWQESMEDAGPAATCAAIRAIMRFWLSRGCDGFRVDMADSLVKNDDDNKSGTIRTWRKILGPIKEDYPQAAFVSEWGRPWQSLSAGFDMDFYLDWGWVPNGYNILVRQTKNRLSSTGDKSYFAARSGTEPLGFLADYMGQYERSKDLGSFSFITCNHDTPRLAPRLSGRELRLAYALVLTMPGVPFVYYGDEIGMRYRILPSKEGGYGRTGSRTPMQWNNSPNKGFSAAPADKLYLPVDPSPDAPTVAGEENDPDSLLSFFKRLIAVRHAHEKTGQALDPSADFLPIFARRGRRPFVYERVGRLPGLRPNLDDSSCNNASRIPERIIVALNPGTGSEEVPIPLLTHKATALLTVGKISITTVKESGSSAANTLALRMDPQSLGIYSI